MALIKCPNCGNEVSDKADHCVHCGYALTGKSQTGRGGDVICPECGHRAYPEKGHCPRCGCPIAGAVERHPSGFNSSEQPGSKTPKGSGAHAKHRHSRKKKSHKKAGVIVAVVIIVVAVVGGAFGYSQYQADKQAEEEAAAYQEYVDNYNGYIDLLNETSSAMLAGAIEAEEMCNTTSDVWNSAIFKSYQGDWSKKIRKYYSTDFNKALKKLYSDTKTQSKVQSLTSSKAEVDSDMSDLKNPDDVFSDAYDALSEVYESYSKLVSLATSPTGSYQSYTADFNDADNDFATKYSKYGNRVPDKIE